MQGPSPTLLDASRPRKKTRNPKKTKKNENPETTQKEQEQIKKLEDEHGVIPGKQIPEIPPEQANITEVTDPEEDKDKLN